MILLKIILVSSTRNNHFEISALYRLSLGILSRIGTGKEGPMLRAGNRAACEQNCWNSCMEQTSSQIARSVPGCLSFQMKGDTRSLLCLQAAVPGPGCTASRKHQSLLSDTDFSGTCRAGEIRDQLSPSSNINTGSSHQLHHYKPWLGQGACIFAQHRHQWWSLFNFSAPVLWHFINACV